MSAMLEVFQANEAALRRYLQRHLRPGMDLEDSLQEAFLLAFKAEQAQKIANPRAFLFTVARNVALGELRRAGTSPIDRYESADRLLEIDGKADSSNDSSTIVDGQRKLIVLVQAIQSLPPRCREAFLLRRVDGLSFKSIAEQMAISPSAAEKHVALGLVRCKQALEAEGYSPEEFGASRSEGVPLVRFRQP